jgi:hypothetical protein
MTTTGDPLAAFIDAACVPLDSGHASGTLEGVDRLIAACAVGDAAKIRAIASGEPHLVSEVIAIGGTLLAKFSGTGNPAGVCQLLDLGVDVRTPFTEGDGYWGAPFPSGYAEADDLLRLKGASSSSP